MRQIIKGLIFDTATASIVAQGDNGLNSNDCWYRSEELYRTPRGNYFIYDSAPNIRPVDLNDNTFGDENFTQTVHEWLNDWNIQRLEEREIKLFGIKCA